MIKMGSVERMKLLLFHVRRYSASDNTDGEKRDPKEYNGSPDTTERPGNLPAVNQRLGKQRGSYLPEKECGDKATKGATSPGR
jgi:hypothetical protein